MFDWDDQELANILWGKDTEADDHIVPYPEDIGENDFADLGDNDQKTLNQEATTYIKGAEKTQTSNLLSQEKNDGVRTSASGTAKDPQLDSSPFSTSKMDHDAIAKETEVGIGPEVSGNQHEDKKLGELVGNNWANIGSFDDLDRMFCNDELDGHSSLGGPDELWPSSKDFTRGAFKALSGDLDSKKWEFGELGSTFSKTELTSEYMHEYPSAAMRFVKTDSSKSGSFVEQECTMGTSALIEEKDDLSTNPQKYQQITNKITDFTPSAGDVYDTCPSDTAVFSHYDRLHAPITVPSFPSAVHSDFCNRYVDPFEHNNLPRHHSASHMVKPIINERPMNMTPQEKIEKLRRRQQMRAMLAIHKQQQQLSHQASRVDYPVSQKICEEDSFLHTEKAELEVNENLSAYSCDLGSSSKKANVSTICDTDEYSSADMVLYQLLEIIARLDMKTRLCIKDSLFRLAHSATQRNYARDANAANSTSTSHPEITEEDLSSHNRIAGNAIAETETNHIDRAVAHLLFHRPFKAFVKPAKTPESSHSNKVCTEKVDSKAKSFDKNLDLPRPFVGSCQEELSHSEMQLNRTKQKL